jgi:hypothetical protein
MMVHAGILAGLARSAARPGRYFWSPFAAIPLTVICTVAWATANTFLWHLPGYQGLAQLALGAVITGAVGHRGGKALSRPLTQGGGYRRGTVITEYTNDRPSERSPAERAPEVTLAGRAVPAQDETKHFKLVGTTGTGKSTAIREILQTALARGDRAVIADSDGAYMQHFYDPARGDLVLNPFDERSAKWDLFGEIRTAYDVPQLARSLIPEHGGRDGEWREYARTFFTAVTRQAWEAGNRDVGELYRLLVVAEVDELRGLVRGTPAQPFLESNNGRMFDSIRSVTSSAVGALDYVGAQGGRPLSVRRWVGEEKQGVLFIPYRAGQIAALRSTISAWMRLAIFERMNSDGLGDEQRRKGDRLWFIVDELDALGQIDGLKDALARLRKFEGRCVLGFQSVAQVSSTYGQGDAHTIVENCGNTLILRCSASEGGGTAKFASQLIGDREVGRMTISRSRRSGELFDSVTRSEHISMEPAVLPSQIEQLADLTGYLKYASEPEWRQIRLDARRTWERFRCAEADASVGQARQASDSRVAARY